MYDNDRFDPEPQRYYDWMLWKMRQERKKQMIKKGKKYVWVTFEKEGLHKYPAALDDPKLKTGDWDDVSFLGYLHRHIFKFRVQIEVFTDDRDIEFIQFKRWLQRLYSSTEGSSSDEAKNMSELLVLDFKSCEMICDELAEKIIAKYPHRELIIDVSEDGENGAHCIYEGE